MKKLMALLLALVLSFSLVACGKNAEKEDPKEETKATDKADKDEKKKDEDKDKEKDKEADAEAEATAVAEGFMDAFIDLDAKAAAKYVDDAAVIEDSFGSLKEALLEGMMSEITDEFDELSDMGVDVDAKLDELADAVLDKFKAEMSYEIIDATQDDGDYVFTVEMTLPTDLDNADDLEAEMTDMFSEETLMALVEEWAAAGLLDEDSTDAEIAELLIDEVFTALIDIIEFTTSSSENELVVIQDGSDWVVDTEASGF